MRARHLSICHDFSWKTTLLPRGHNATPDDDFADAALVDRVHAHAKHLLSTAVQGAQLIVVDNSPTESVSDDVVTECTRRADIPPYGLIADAVS